MGERRVRSVAVARQDRDACACCRLRDWQFMDATGYRFCTGCYLGVRFQVEMVLRLNPSGRYWGE